MIKKLYIREREHEEGKKRFTVMLKLKEKTEIMEKTRNKNGNFWKF